MAENIVLLLQNMLLVLIANSFICYWNDVYVYVISCLFNA